MGEIALLSVRQLPAAAGVLARAFVEDPMMVYLMPDASRRPRVLTNYFGSVLRQAGRAGVLSAVSEGDVPVGVSIVMPFGSYPLPILPQLAEWRTIVRAGARSTVRNFRDLAPIDRARPGEPFEYLMFLGSEPAQQGHGHGARLLRHFLERSEDVGRTAYLVTMLESNVEWYRHFGFEVARELRMGRRGPRAWSLARVSGVRTSPG
jgi:ribosomal protein S18 acetylase RimI-like enzyme